MTAIEFPSNAAAPMERSAEAVWPFAKRWTFAFIATFFFLMNWQFPWTSIPLLRVPVEWVNDAVWGRAVVFVATHILHTTVSLAETGSGDSSADYILVAICISAAVIAAFAFAFIDRSAAHYERISDWFRVFLRFALAGVMIVYGTAKLVPSQFSAPTLDRLIEPFGAASPMGLLWTFMGASRAYTILTGAVETIGGLLLAVRRTTLLGALISAGAMANVVALNFCYDVPVKLFSMQLFLEAIVIASPDLSRLANLLLINRDAAPRSDRPLFSNRWAARACSAAGVLFIAALLVIGLRQSLALRRDYGDLAPRSPLRGVWSVDELTDNGVARPPLTTDLTRWRRFVFDSPRLAYIQFMSDARLRYRFELNEKTRTIKLTDWENPKRILTIAYARPEAGILLLDTTIDAHKMHAVCRLSDTATKPLLTTRGFHWISEFPFNR